jgi:uncharacterized cupredoxin-like copper-binding protein
MAAGRTRTSLLVPVAALALLAAACGEGTDTPSTTPSTTSPSETSPAGGTVNVTEKDFSIAVDPSSTAAGTIDFSITNEGPSTHEFVVFKTDLTPEALPTTEGDVNEEGEGVEHVDEKEDIAAGTTTTLEVTLDAGNYVLLCNLPGHYKLGMHVGFTVK